MGNLRGKRPDCNPVRADRRAGSRGRIGFQAPVPAEALKWNYDNRMANAMLSVDGQLDRVMGVKGAQPITYQMADGTAMRIMPRQYKKFYRAVADHIRRSDQARRIQGVAEPDAPPAVRQAADDIEAYFRFMADEGEYVKLFGEAVASKPGRFTPRRWRRLSIEANQVQFKDKLYAQAKRNREVDYYTGRRLNEENRVVEDGAITFERDGRSTARGLSAEEREAIREFLKKDGTARAEITEADLREAVGDAVMDRYFEEVDLYLRGQVDATYKTLVSPTNAHGVTRAMPSSVQRRLLEVDEAEFSEFLVSDLEQLVSGYHQQLSGRIAARRAIQRDTELIKLLRERGIDIEAKGFDPALVIKAVGDDFSDQISLLERGGHSKLAKKIRDNRDAMVGEDGTSGVLGLKLEEMEGFNRFNVGVSAGYRLAQNLALRAPVLAYLGKVTVSSVTDMASLVFIRGMRRRHFRAMSQALNLFKEMPRAELEALYVANTAASRSSRANKLFDLDDTGGADPFGQGQRSRVMQRVDRVSESMVDLQFKYGAMNRWNGNMKAMAAVIFQHEMIQNAKKLARANRLMRAGTDKDAALKQVELSEPDAALMNRLGIDGRRADRMMSVIAEHGTALNKTRTAPEKRWANQAEFEKYDGYVSPEYAVWGGKDRDLLEVMTTAVNRMVQDIIVEPKMLSRPLMNRRWWGRMFNQMQSFAFAWGNQHAQLAAARPAHEQIFALFMGIGTGAIADAIHNDLSGRRSFAETGREWADNPAGMVYGSVARSALLGWLARPVGFADQQPWGPGRLLGNNQLSGTYSRPIDWFGFLAGPAGSWLKSAADPLWRLAGSGELDERSQRQLFLAMPYRNSLIVEGAIQAMEAAGIEPPDFTRPTQPNNRR